MKYKSTKIIELGSCAFRQWKADSHCKFIHGYRLIAKFWFECTGLDDKNWVVDFGGLNELKDILQKQFDHTTCISADDPLLETFKNLHNCGAIDLRIMDNGVGIERTAEFCLKIANNYIKEKTVGRCWVSKVEVWEHEKNSAIVTLEEKNNIKHVPIAPIKIEMTPDHDMSVHTDISKDTPKGAPIGNKVTSGWSNPFGGTSWGV